MYFEQLIEVKFNCKKPVYLKCPGLPLDNAQQPILDMGFCYIDPSPSSTFAKVTPLVLENLHMVTH
jgi:hypothetical protein